MSGHNKPSSAISRSSSRSSSGRKPQKGTKNKKYSSDSDSDVSAGSFLSSSQSYSPSFSSDSDTKLSSSRKSSLRRSNTSLHNNKKSPKEEHKIRNGSDKISNKFSLSSSSSTESLRSVKSQQLSKANSLVNLEAEYEPIATNLPFNVYQALFSIKTSNLNIYTLKKEFQENLTRIKKSAEEAPSLVLENEKITDAMVTESTGAIALIEVIYGNIHWKLAKEHTNLAMIYLEFKSLPKQARVHCEKAWSILVAEFTHKARLELHGLENQNEENDDDESSKAHLYPDCNKHQMILNYIYGRASTLLKENEQGEMALESSAEYCKLWQDELKSDVVVFLKFKSELNSWKQKIYLSLAKQLAINQSNRQAIEYYDKCMKVLLRKKKRSENFTEHERLVVILKDKSKIELKKHDEESFLRAVDLSKEAIRVAEESDSQILIADCKLNLAKIFAKKDDMNSTNKAEELFNEVIRIYAKLTEPSLNEHTIKAKDELVKFFLKEHKYEDACKLLNELAKEKVEFYGDFSIKCDSTYKLLCSVYLVKNDMPSAAKFLQKSLEIEEINYGNKSKKYLSTKETLDNLKKNPNVQAKLKIGSPEVEVKPFVTKQKIDYSKSDYKIYSPLAATSTSEVGSNGTISDVNNKSINEESFVNKKINPLK